MTAEHDWSNHPDGAWCIACALPLRCWEMPCKPSTDDSAEAISEIEMIARD